jgi:NADH-quinone oxidoreductase subunit C
MAWPGNGYVTTMTTVPRAARERNETMSDALAELGTHIEMKRPDCVLGWDIAYGELTVTVALSSIAGFIEFLKVDQTCRFSTLVDITAVDYPDRPKRFEVIYHLLSMYQNHRIRLRVAVREEDMVPSITDVHPSANWFEREVFDMFGLLFSGHPDLRRILTDYGFRGFPLRKDFPTTGYTEVRYDEVQKRVVYEPVSLVQEYRQFDFMSPWEGADYILPGDEKKEGAK